MNKQELIDYFMSEVWPCLSDEQRKALYNFAKLLSQYSPKWDNGDDDGKDKKNG